MSGGERVTMPDADIERIVANETAINFDGRDLLAEVERLREERDKAREQREIMRTALASTREERDRLAAYIETAMRELERVSDVRANRTKILGNAHLILQEALPEREDGT